MTAGKFFLTKRIKLVQLADLLINDLNLNRNDIVLVNVSLTRFNLIDSTPTDLIHLLKMIVGTQGIILMPGISVDSDNDLSTGGSENKVKGLAKDELINSIFRKLPDTVQSLLPSQSFSAWGSKAKLMTEIQQQSGLNTENNDLFFRLFKYQAKIVGIGVPLNDFYLYPVPEKTNKLINPEPIEDVRITSSGDGSGTHFLNKFQDIIRSKSQLELSEIFTEDEVKVISKGGIPFFRIDAEKAFSKVIITNK